MQLLNNGGDLINYVADHHNDTIVYVEAPGPVDMEPWASHPNVTAIMYGYFGGQEMGHAIANVAFGDVNPSGKLPFTLAKEVSDYPLNLYNGPEPLRHPEQPAVHLQCSVDTVPGRPERRLRQWKLSSTLRRRPPDRLRHPRPARRTANQHRRLLLGVRFQTSDGIELPR